MATSKSKRYQYLAWFICALGAIYYSYEYFLRIAPSVMEPQLRAHFNLSAAGFGFLSAFYYYAYVPMQLPVGVLMDRYGPRRLLTLACSICVIGTFLFAATPSFFIAAIGRFMVGFGSAFAFVGVLKLATIWLPEDRLAMVAGLAAALGTIGAMIGDNILGFMVYNIGWQPTSYTIAGCGILLTFILWFGIIDNKRAILQNRITSFRGSWIDLKIIAKNKQIWLNGMYGCLVYLPTTVFAELWGIQYLINAHNLTVNEAHFANSLLFLGFTIGAPLMGYLSDHYKRRKPLMVFGAFAAGFVMLLIMYANLPLYWLYFLMICLGILYSVQNIIFVVARELSPLEAAGTAIAMTNMMVMVGAMLLQPLVGELLDFSVGKNLHEFGSKPTIEKMAQIYTVTDYQYALSIVPIGIFIGAILILFVKETYAIVAQK